MEDIKKPAVELLAPAGDMERLRAALHFGADAVYVGGPQLQLRAEAVGFDMPGLAAAAEYAHDRGTRLYVTVNSFAFPDEMDSVGDYARQLKDAGVDAVIVSDLGVVSAIKAAAPDLEVHISTQANCTNHLAARHYYEMGAKRVVLARELSLAQIAEIRARVPAELELEAFVHGAMCMAYSGRCLLSAYMSGRSGNRGECTQPCRWDYHLVEQKREGEFFPISEDGNGTAILSSFDLNCVEHLDEIVAAGICSLKIEGRMKSPYYVATVVNAYRHALSGDMPMEAIKSELDCASHRPYSTGFYYGAMRKRDAGEGAYSQTCRFIASVLEADGESALVEQRNRFALGDRLEVLSPRDSGRSFLVTEIISSKSGEPLSAAIRPQEHLRINCPYELHPGDMLRLRT